MNTQKEPFEAEFTVAKSGVNEIATAPLKITEDASQNGGAAELQLKSSSQDPQQSIVGQDTVWKLDPECKNLIKAVSVHSEAANRPGEDIVVVRVAEAGGLFAVVDGHGGREAAQHVAHTLPLKYSSLVGGGAPRGRALLEALAECEDSLLKASQSSRLLYASGACLVAAVTAPVRESTSSSSSSSTSPADPAPSHQSEGQQGQQGEGQESVEDKFTAPLVVANIGDSRAVLGVLFEGEVLPYCMSKTHNTSNTVEILRLQGSHPLGMKVVTNEAEPEDPRVAGISQVTRSLGDAYLKGVPAPCAPGSPSGPLNVDTPNRRKRKKPEPIRAQVPLEVLSASPFLDSMTEELNSTCQAPACFLVLGSDGLFDHLSDGEVCTFIDNHVKAGKPRDTVSKELVEAVFKRAAFKQNDARCTTKWLLDLKPGEVDEWNRSRREIVDDTSVIVIFFR